jgi:hypothetical protein
MKIEEVN